MLTLFNLYENRIKKIIGIIKRYVIIIYYRVDLTFFIISH